MAIEYAVLLEVLLRREEPVETLLAEFMARGFDRAKFVIKSSDRVASWEPESWQGIHDFDARPGEVLHEASVALLEDF